LAFEVKVELEISAADVASTSPSAFGAAMLAAATAQLPAADRAATALVVVLSEKSVVSMSTGTLDLSVSAERVALRNSIRASACAGMDGKCEVTFLAGARRALREEKRRALAAADVEVERSYSYGDSTNAGVPLDTMLEADLAALGVTVSDVTQTELKAEMTVISQGNARTSGIDDAFQDGSTLSSELGVWLPGTTLTISEPTVITPPPPPQPPPPPLPRDPPGFPFDEESNLDTGSAPPIWMYVVGYAGAGILILLVMGVGALFVRRRLRGKGAPVLPNQAKVATSQPEARPVEVDGCTSVVPISQGGDNSAADVGATMLAVVQMSRLRRQERVAERAKALHALVHAANPPRRPAHPSPVETQVKDWDSDTH
jgi:hypothetical protein